MTATTYFFWTLQLLCRIELASVTRRDAKNKQVTTLTYSLFYLLCVSRCRLQVSHDKRFLKHGAYDVVVTCSTEMTYSITYSYFQVTGIMTQGRGDGAEWVTRFMVSTSMDAYHWSYVTDTYGNQWVC